MANEKGEFRNGFFKDMDSIAVWTHEPNAYAMHSSIYMLVLSLLFMKNDLFVLHYPTFYCMIVLLNAE